MVDLRRAAAIVGVHEHVTRYSPDKSELQIQGESVIKALDDAGLSQWARVAWDVSAIPCWIRRRTALRNSTA